MSKIDDELEEIKRLIADNSGSPAESSKKLVTVAPKQAVPATPRTQEKNELSVRPAAQKPAKASPKAPPAVTVRPGTPAVPAKPGAPVRPVPPSKPAKPSAPAKPGPGGIGEQTPPQRRTQTAQGRPVEVRSFDISQDSKITDHADADPEVDMGSAKFKMKFDFESNYRDVPEDRPLRWRREKRTGCVGGILYAAFVICASLALASLLWMAAVDVLGFGMDDEKVNVIVQDGFTIEDITDMLYDAGLIKYKFLFNTYAEYSNAEEKITAGQYVLNKDFDYRAIVQGMTARAGVRVETTVTIPEGYTLAQIFTLLEDYGVCPATDLWESATNHSFNFHFLDDETLGDRLRLEGFLFPDTYNFYMGSTPEQALNRLLREFDRRFTETYIERVEAMGYTIRDVINIAAMIEREAGSDEERPRISAVIYNRLESRNFPYLQVDATIHYAIAGTGRPFSIEIDHPYNTYINEGLPPGPIANPGMESIRAALYPESTNEYYYALNKEGTHNFFRTYEQHRAFVNSSQYGGN